MYVNVIDKISSASMSLCGAKTRKKLIYPFYKKNAKLTIFRFLYLSYAARLKMK